MEATPLLGDKIMVKPPLLVIIFSGDTLLRLFEDYSIILFTYDLC
jgi:hypothetical protein